MESISEPTPIADQSERSSSGFMKGLRSPLTLELGESVVALGRSYLLQPI